jgi:RNA polymerase sigma-70 factor (sigma-E family)
VTPEQERDFRRFVSERSAALLRAGYYLTGDAHLARDLLQIGLLAAARKWTSIREPAAAEAYVRRAMYRHQIDSWRIRARRPETPVAVLADRPIGGDHAADTALRQGLFDALRSLPAGQRAVVVLRYWEDRSETEVADLLGVSVGTVRSQSSKALARLRTRFPELITTEVTP